MASEAFNLKPEDMFTPRGEKYDFSIIPDLSGKVALVTGANSPGSIGYQIAQHLAQKGAKVYIGARSESKANGAIETLLKSNLSLKPEQLGSFVADLGDLKQVERAADALLEKESRLDILVNNAALLARPLDKNEHGLSVSMTTNHLAPFLLTTKLLPLFEKASQQGPDAPRVVFVSAASIKWLPPTVRFRSVDDLNAALGGPDGFFANFQRYSLSKLANALTAKELQRRAPYLVSLAVHPGEIVTDGTRPMLEASGGAPAQVLSVEEGVLTPLWAAAAPEAGKLKGAFIMPFKEVAPEEGLLKDEGLAKELWETSEAVVKDVLAKA
ncbi:NAD(P)-binding protein [Schizophyllum commune Loenen D]|nr:NAD(P)-binding protein [Schizophyllum commune Loenen D]